MPFDLKKFYYLLILPFLAILLNGCSSTMKNNTEKSITGKQGYSAKIQRTSYNIPHITADDLPSAWFGQGYAMAEDRICVLLDQVTKIRGHRSRYFGAGEGDVNIDSDFGYKHLGLLANAKKNWAGLDAEIQDMLTAHAAGINKFIADKGASQLPKACRNAAWVTEVTPTDLFAIVADFNVFLSGRFLLPYFNNAQPPKAGDTPEPIHNHHDHNHNHAHSEESPGSNGWGLGSDLTDSGNGILLAQPHFPWEGDLQAWESHVTVAGKIDIYGITVPGIPNVLVGFNSNIAWTLTVTTSPKATLYKLALDPDDPTRYLYNGKSRAMEPSEYTIDVLADSGKIEKQSRTLWRSHYGSMLSVPTSFTAGLADYRWLKKEAITNRDANLDNNTMLSQFLDMSRAGNLDSFIDVHKRWAGSIPFSNTVATSVDGEAWYADSSPVPNLSTKTYNKWKKKSLTDVGLAALSEHGIYVLDGTTSDDEWIKDPRSLRDGIIPFADAPQMRRRDFVFNSNGTPWLTNPSHPLEGYAPLYGAEKSAPSLRTRMNALELAKGTANNKLSLQDVKNASLSNHAITASLIRAELVERCTKTPTTIVNKEKVDIKEACTILTNWDERFDLDSKGAVLFREFIGAVSDSGYSHMGFTGEGTLFATPFNEKDPIATPKDLDSQFINGQDRILIALGTAIKILNEANIPLDAVLRDYQFTIKNGKKIPVHGGNGQEGILSIAAYGKNGTLLPGVKRGEVIHYSTDLTKEGYVVNYGTSFLMAVELTKKGPQCQAIMSFSQSTDTDSVHFSDQTELYSKKGWRDCHYSHADIQADSALREYTVEK